MTEDTIKTVTEWLLSQHTIVIILIGVNYIQWKERTRLLKATLDAARYLGTVDRSLQHMIQILQIRSAGDKG